MFRSAFCIVLLAPVLACGAPPTWKRVESKPGQFSVEFPDTPTENKGGFKSGGKPWYDTYTFTLRRDRVSYIVKATVPTEHLPVFMSVGAMPREARSKLLAMTKKSKGKVLLDRESTSASVQGYAVIVESPSRAVKTMIRAGWYVLGGIGYEIRVSGPSDQVRGKDIDRFFKSFKMGQ
jgi:hypothetical protein